MMAMYSQNMYHSLTLNNCQTELWLMISFPFYISYHMGCLDQNSADSNTAYDTRVKAILYSRQSSLVYPKKKSHHWDKHAYFYLKKTQTQTKHYRS
jgi:hypothetical protein